jgi:uncharacterized protein (DUF1697 family)
LSPSSKPSRQRSAPAARGSKGAARYVALLRAVNVGGRVIKMDELRRVFESLAFANVQTFIASGNVIFEAAVAAKPAAIEEMIEAGLQKAFKYPIPTFVRSTAEMVAAAEQVPFDAGELTGAGLYVTFYKRPLSRGETSKVEAMRNRDDDFAVAGRELYWLRRRMAERMGEPFPALGKAVEAPGTMRSITTVKKIAAKYCGGTTA